MPCVTPRDATTPICRCRFKNWRAETVIDGIASEFARKHIGENACLISLHECLITTEEHVEELKAFIESAFQLLVGFAPPVTVARFSDDAAEFGETLIAA